MNAGDLRHRVTLQARSVARDALGAEVETWVDAATVWAAVEPLRGREYFASQQINAELTTRIRIRFRQGVRPEMRVKFGTKEYDIQSVIKPDERNIELHLMCKERDA